jgi:general secretion pathway protein C
MISFKHRWIADIVVVSLILYFGVDAFITLLDNKLAPIPVATQSGVKLGDNLEVEVRPLEEYAIIAERNLFGGNGKGSADHSPQDIALDNMPVAVKSLGLKLVGTVVANKANESSAIIEDQSTRKQEVYREGDRIREIQIKRILRHNVVINTGARDEVLTMLPEESAATARPPRPSRSVRPAPTSSSSIRLDRDDLESQMANLNELMQQVRIRPFMEGKRPAGFLISNIKPGSLFSKMGLRNGDVIQGVNGESVSNPEQAIELYEGLMEGGDIELDIKRGRRRQKLQYEIQ